jgi:hypothetical protein
MEKEVIEYMKTVDKWSNDQLVTGMWLLAQDMPDLLAMIVILAERIGAKIS